MASMIIFFIGYINCSYLASRFDIIIIFFENVIDINVVLFIIVIFYILLIIVLGFLLLVLLVYFKGYYGRLSHLLSSNTSYRCNCSLFRLLLAFLHLSCAVVFLLLSGFLLTIFFIVFFILDIATIVNLYWLGVYYRKCLFAVVLILALSLTLPTPLHMFFICYSSLIIG